MSTDRELLEFAAKARGGIKYFNYAFRSVENGYREWNPLADDGDALRLAVRLMMYVDVHENWCEAESPLGQAMRERSGEDSLAATRMAIVRAAAEIGMAMP